MNEKMNRRDFLKGIAAAAAVPAIDSVVSGAAAQESAETDARVREVLRLLDLGESITVGTQVISASALARGIRSTNISERIVAQARLSGVLSLRLMEVARTASAGSADDKRKTWDRVKKAGELLEGFSLPEAPMRILRKDIDAIRILAERSV